MSPLPPSLAVEDEKTPERSDSYVEETWSRAMITIQNEDLEESIDSLKIIVYELDRAKTGTPATIQLLKDSANELVRELQRRLKRVTHFSHTPRVDVSSLVCTGDCGCDGART